MARLRAGAALLTALALIASGIAACAAEPVRIGLVLPMTGGLAAIGRQAMAGIRLFMTQNGDSVAGRKIEILLRDDAGQPDTARRHVRELIVNDKVALIGAGLTPSALAAAPLVTEARIPTVVMVSGTRIVTDRSPYMVRTSFTLGSQSAVMAGYAARTGSRRAVIVHSDWAPGAEAAAAFSESFTRAGGTVLDVIKPPLANPDFAPFLQRARDAKSDTLFVFVPTGQAGTFARQFAERGLGRAGIRLVGTGDITDDDDLPAMGDAVLGTVTAGVYSPRHDTPVNRAYVAAFMAANPFRPNHISLGGYDGMRLIYAALAKTGGATDGDALVAAMKGEEWESPRGVIAIDPATREIRQPIYIRRVERIDGELHNVEFETIPAAEAIAAR